MSKTPRILHAPTDVGGHAHGLSRAEGELGLRSDVVVFAGGPYEYEADLRFDLADRPRWQRLRKRAGFLRASLSRYDVYHFNFGQSLLQIPAAGRLFDELAFLRRMGKRVIVTFQGCDVRPQAACHCTATACSRDDRYRPLRARRFLALADHVFFLNPDLRRWLPGATFLPYASFDPLTVAVMPFSAASDEVVVLHAPTNREVKGTAYVIDAIAQLRREGLPVRLDLVEGVTRAEAVSRYAAADVVVDQLHIGWYGGLALEAMALGRPVMCHIREDEPADNPFGDELPVVRTRPETLTADLGELIADRPRRERTGRAGREFAERHHDPRAVARRVLEEIGIAVPDAPGPFPSSGRRRALR